MCLTFESLPCQQCNQNLPLMNDVFRQPRCLTGQLGEVASGCFVALKFGESGTADWPDWRNATGRKRSPDDRPIFKLIAGKLSLNFDTLKRPFADDIRLIRT
jgi:hypothetical protein